MGVNLLSPLKMGDAFEMLLATGDSRTKPKCNRKRNPSYLHPESHGDSGMTANLPETNDAEEEEQESEDENDLIVRFSSLGRSMKTFQRDLITADQKVES